MFRKQWHQYTNNISKKHIRWHWLADYFDYHENLSVSTSKIAVNLCYIIEMMCEWSIFQEYIIFFYILTSPFSYGCVRMRKLIHFMKRYLDNNMLTFNEKTFFFLLSLFHYSPSAINRWNDWHIWYRAANFIDKNFIFIWIECIATMRRKTKSNKRFNDS